ncbi:MAG: RNA repair transcriptional activator RtcR [Pontiellaceae bacterium]|nr:RNA repair transcriptional activator RtcR [Pontiellaceae bacterium]
MKTVVIGFVGTMLDRGTYETRWEKWRPTVALCQQDDLLIDRFELICDRRYNKLLEVIEADIAAVSPETEVVRRYVNTRNPWDFQEMYGLLHDFAQDYSFDPENEDYLVHITTGTHVAQICMFLLAEARHIPGRLIQTSPARNRNDSKGTYSIIDLDLTRYDQIASRMERVLRDDLTFLKAGIETRNVQYNALIEQIEKVAIKSRDPMLLMGATGAGKSFLARRVHELKRSKMGLSGRFIEVNCATLHGSNALATLFGHKKGAYTGAVQDRKGLLLEANGGLLFLDEIGDLGLDEQAMLLKAVEEKRFYPMGSDCEVESDFQLICGTNRDLHEDVRDGNFRDDLFARINLWTFALPGLKERPEDIEPNLQFELDRHTAKAKYRVRFSKEARERYLRFAKSSDAQWNANFRDLGSSVTRMATLADAGRITVEVVNDEIQRLKRSWSGGVGVGNQDLLRFFSPEELAQMDQFDQLQLVQVIDVCTSAKSLADAGRRLFNVSREKRQSTNDSDRLRKYLQKFGLDWNAIRSMG